MPPAARTSDTTTHLTPALPGVGSINVLIGSLPAWRTLDDTCVCPIPVAPPAPAPHGPEKCYLGSTTVLINSRMACRVGDILQAAGPPNPFATGCLTVLIGDAGFGMASPANAAAYAAAMLEVFNNWDSMSPEERLAGMQAALNSSLPPGMPGVQLVLADMPATTHGRLNFTTWRVEINRGLMQGSMSHGEFSYLSNTVYHEGRHGQQWYNAAQYRRGQGQSAADIARETGMRQDVAEAAARAPVQPGTSEAALGESTNTSVYGSRGNYREQVYSDMRAGQPGAYEQYRALPEEVDARGSGERAQEAFDDMLLGPP